MDRIEQNIKKLEAKLAQEPKNIVLWNNLGYFHDQAGRTRKAVECFQAALELDRNYIPSNYAMGNILFKMGKFDEAMVFYQKVLAADSKHWQAYYGIAVLYSSRKEYALSIQNFEKVLELNPDSLDSYYFMAKIYEEMKQYGKASRKYKEFAVLAVKMKKTKEYLVFLKDAENKAKELDKTK